MSTGRYLKHAQARPQFQKSGHVTIAKKPYPYASYPAAGHAGTDRYTSTPKPCTLPNTRNRTNSQQQQQQQQLFSPRDSNNWNINNNNWTHQRSQSSRSDSDGRHDNGSYSPDSVFTVSSGSNLSYHGGGGGGGGGFTGGSGEVFREDLTQSSGMKPSRSMLDVRDLFSETSSLSSSSWAAPRHLRSTSFLGTGSDDIHQGEFVKVKVGNFKEGPGGGGGGMTRNRFKSEPNLFEAEAEETSLRWDGRRTDVSVAVPSSIPVRIVTMRKSKGMFGFILNCKPISGDPCVPEALRSFPHVESIVENSVAMASGLRCGDFVLQIGSQSVEKGSFDRCNFLIRSSGDCLRLMVASSSYGQLKKAQAASIRTVQNATAATTTTTTESRRLPDGFSSRKPVAYESFMERRCNEAKRKHVNRPAQPPLQRATSVPNLAAAADNENNYQQQQHVYEELNETAAPRNAPLRPTLPSQGLGRSTSNASRNRNWTARNWGAGSSAQLTSIGRFFDAGTRKETAPIESLPSLAQTNFLHDRDWGKGLDVRRGSVGSLRVGVTGREGPSDARNPSRSDGEITAASDKEDSADTRTPGHSGPLEGVREKVSDQIGILSAEMAPDPVSTPPAVISQNVARFSNATYSTDGGFSCGVEPITPISNSRVVATCGGLSPGGATTIGSLVPGGKTSVEPRTWHSPAVATTGTTGIPTKTSQVAPRLESLANRKAEVTSSDDEDDDPSPLLSAIRSHPLMIRNHRQVAQPKNCDSSHIRQVEQPKNCDSSHIRQVEQPKNCDSSHIRQVEQPKNCDSSRIRQVEQPKNCDSSRIRQVAPPYKRPAPLPLPKRKPGQPGKGTGSTNETLSSAPVPSQQTFAKNSPANHHTEAGNHQKTELGSKTWNKNAKSPAKKSNDVTAKQETSHGPDSAPHGTNRPTTNQRGELGRRHVTSDKSSELNLTPSARVLNLTGVTTEHSHSEEREEEGGAKEEEERESKFSDVNVRLNFDDVTGKLILGGATVDESEIDPVSLPPPPLDFTSGTGPGRVVPSTGGSNVPTNKEQFLNVTSSSGDDVTAFVDVTSLPPPVSFDVIPEEEPDSRDRFNPDDVTRSKLRRTNFDLGSSMEAKATGTGRNLQPLQQELPVLPSRDHRPSGGSHLQESKRGNQTEFPGSSKAVPPTPLKSSGALGAKGNSASTTAIPPSSPHPKNRSVADWSCADVGDWLRSLGFERHAQLFVSRSVDGQRLCDLTRKDFIDLGVTEMEHRRDIERSVLRLKWQQTT